MTAVKTRYSAAELAALQLPILPATRPAIFKRASNEEWPYIEVKGGGGKGGLRREYTPPALVMNAIKEKAAEQLVATVTTGTELVVSTTAVHGETEKQRQVADARKGILQAIERMMKETNWPLKTCAKKLLITAREGKASDHMIAMLKMARDGRGRQSADGLPSDRSLIRFVEYQQNGTLAPKKRSKDMGIPEWAQAFLSEYQKASKPTVAHAYSEFVKRYSGAPSIHAVRRWLDKVGNVALQHGRMGDREIKALKPFTRRGFDDLLPDDIFTGDGHTFDTEVQHPLHGRPFRPEMTLWLSVGTRKAVGWSAGLAESSLTVLDALRNAVETHGIPAIVYVDNGSGYKNQMVTDPATGLLGRIGTEMINSLPYNSQSRGVIERAQKSIWIKLAKKLPGYIGHDMDREAKLATFKLSRNAIRKGGAMPLLGWPAFLEACQEQLDEYNNTPHRSLKKITCQQTGKRRHQTPNEAWEEQVENGWQPHTVTEAEAQTLFRPQIMRTIRRGEIELLNNRYFSADLEEFNGEYLPVGYDIHDPQWVWVYDEEGRLITKAEVNGNKRDYMPKAVIEQARDKREAGRLKRLEVKAEEIRAERRGSLPIEQSEDIVIPGVFSIKRADLAARAEAVTVDFKETETPASLQEIVPEIPAWSVPETPAERWETWKELDALSEDVLDAHQKKWRQTYQSTAEFRAFSNKQQFG